MESTESAVWQRVRSPGMEQPEDTEGLLREAQALYRSLQSLRQGTRHPAAAALAENQQAVVEALRGVCLLRGRKNPSRFSGGPEPGSGKKLMAECYHCSRRAMAEYAARSALPETGTVFADLAELQRKNCFLLARLLGNSREQA